MIWYALAAGVLIYIFEIIGRYVLSILKIDKFKCSFGIGLIVFLTYSYITTSLITSSNGSFYVVSAIYALFFIAFLALIIKNRKKIDFKIDLINTLIMIIFVFIMSLYAYNTTLGRLDGFDTTYYLNFVTSNIKSTHMNYSYYGSSLEPTYISKQYTFQTYYYIASFLSYVFTTVISIFHKTYYQTTYIWVFQLLFNAFFYSLIINSIELMKNKKNKILSFVIILFFLLVYGRLYFYNVLGFYGNTYRIVTVGYSTLLLYLLTKKDISNDLLLLFMISLLASASVSSSGVFIDIFILYGAYFILCNEYNSILKFYAIPLFFILINLFSVVLNINVVYCVFIAAMISIILYIFGNKLNSILSKKKFLIIILSLSVAFMFISSLLITRNVFDLSAFFHNHSERADMTINYVNLKSSNYLLLLKIFILVLLISSLFSIKKESFIQFSAILIICLFNPFCCPILEDILVVWYRAYDILINPFTIIFYIDLLLGYFKGKKIPTVALIIYICFVFIQNNPLEPLYYHATFKPGCNEDGVNYTNYNKEFKMSQDEKETIDVMYDDILFYKKANPFIITPGYLTHGFITDGRYMYGRESSFWNYKTEWGKQLFAIFYQGAYFGDRVEEVEPKYDYIKKYIDDAKVDYLVVDKTKECYDQNLESYIYLYTKVSEYFYPMFENNRYIVYRCFFQ